MKTPIFLLAFLLATFFAQSQSLTEKDITGTWQVVNVVEKGNHPEQADGMLAAYFDIYPNQEFQLRKKTNDDNAMKYKVTHKNTTWTFNQETQTIDINEGKFPIIVSKNDGLVYFELVGTGMKLEVVKPI